MSSIKKVILIGRLGSNPELRTMPNGEAVTSISIATNETWTDKSNGEKKEQTEWHRCIFFRKQAETVAHYLRKGSLIYIEGKLRTKQWQDQEGKKQYPTEVHAHTFQFLDGKQESPYTIKKEIEKQGNDVPETIPFDDDKDCPF